MEVTAKMNEKTFNGNYSESEQQNPGTECKPNDVFRFTILTQHDEKAYKYTFL